MRVRLLLALLLLTQICPARQWPGPPAWGAAPANSEQRSPRRIVGYFTEWSVYDRKFHVGDILAARLTHLNYAFAKISRTGECALCDSYAAIDKAYPGDKAGAGELRGSFHQLQLLKQKHRHLKTLLSVGGWTLSGRFSDGALSEKSRTHFAKSCVGIMAKYGFDGVDIDWEYPVSGGMPGNKTRPQDRANYTRLLARLRKELDDRGRTDKRHYLLTIAAPASPKTYANLELARIAALVDWINLMTYDFHGSWSARTNFHAPLYAAKGDPTGDKTVRQQFNVHAAVQGYLAAKVPPGRIVVGMAYYGRGWGGVKKANQGLYQRHGPTAPKGTWEAGVWDYKDLKTNYIGKSKRHWHEEAKVPWLFDERAAVMISYDDPKSLRLKAGYVASHHLGGVMIWELSADDAQGSLLRALRAGLHLKP
jgi:chitinase